MRNDSAYVPGIRLKAKYVITVSISVLVYILESRLPSARYHGLRMRQNLVQWIPQIERHMICVDQSEASKE